MVSVPLRQPTCALCLTTQAKADDCNIAVTQIQGTTVCQVHAPSLAYHVWGSTLIPITNGEYLARTEAMYRETKREQGKTL